MSTNGIPIKRPPPINTISIFDWQELCNKKHERHSVQILWFNNHDDDDDDDNNTDVVDYDGDADDGDDGDDDVDDGDDDDDGGWSGDPLLPLGMGCLCRAFDSYPRPQPSNASLLCLPLPTITVT